MRAIRRAVAFLVLTLAHYLWFELAYLFLPRRGKRLFHLRTRIYRSWGQKVARAFRMTLIVKGTPPKPPYFFVMNHLSYVDILLAAMNLDGAKFIAKHELADWLLLGPMARRIETIFVNRNSLSAVADVCEQVNAALKDGYGVGMAPEATTSKGEGVLPFHPALLEPAVRLGVAVCYATIRFRTPPGEMPAYKIVNWWEDMSFQRHALRFLEVKSFEATIHFGDALITGTNRKILAKDLHQAISANFVPMVTGDGEPLDHLS
jgi:1-acyl-sn-glycerol-3-phosphate acyltransferase